MKTKLFYYLIDTANKAGKAQYLNIKKAVSVKVTHTSYFANIITSDCEIEVLGAQREHVFTCVAFGSNLNLSVWCEYPHNNPMIKEGYYLELTKEMIELADSTLFCLRCQGRHKIEKTRIAFCMACLNDPTLKESELHTLYLSPVSVGEIDRKYILIPQLIKDKYKALHP